MVQPPRTGTLPHGGQRRASGAPGLAFLGLFGAVVSYAAVEVAAVVASAELDRPHVQRFASGAGLVLAFAGLVLAVSWALLVRHNLPERALRMTAALGLGLTVSLSVVFVTANGAPPHLRAWPVGRGAGLVAALGLGLTTGLVRWLVFSARHTRAGLAVDPLLFSAALLGADLLLRRADVRQTSGQGLVLVGAATLVAWIAGRLARSLPIWTHDRAAAVVAAGLPLLAGAALVAGFLRGEPLFARRLAAGTPDARPDVLLVVLDTTRADHAPLPVGAIAATPTLARLAAEGTRHTQAFSTSSWTLPAHASLFTGRTPAEHGATWRRQQLDGRLPTLAEQLRATGRHTAAYSANPWITPEFGFGRGFDSFTTVDAAHRPRRPALVALLPSVAARFDNALPFEDKGGAALISAVLRDQGRRPGPTFTFLNLMEPHLPYRPPRRFLKPLRGGAWSLDALAGLDQGHLRGLEPGTAPDAGEVDGLRRLYGGEVAYADWLLGRLVDRLERAGRLDRTLIVITSDHGENVGDHPPLDHQFGVWDTLLRVPLLVRLPGRVPAGSIRDDLVSLADLPDLILALASGAAAPEPAPARAFVVFDYDRPGPLLESLRNRGMADVSRFDRDLSGARTPTAKWIESSDGRHEAYDLVADPGETRNLVVGGAMPAAFADLAALVRSRATTGRDGGRDTAEQEEVQELDEETERRLRSLGYIR